MACNISKLAICIYENLMAEILNVEIKVRCKKDEKGILEGKQKANHTTTFADLVNQDEKLKMIVDVFEADLIK